jgi:hyperosmotically inducible periplasmic protein
VAGVANFVWGGVWGLTIVRRAAACHAWDARSRASRSQSRGGGIVVLPRCNSVVLKEVTSMRLTAAACALACVVSATPVLAEQHQDADNTGRNVRDRGESVTPPDQSNNAADVETTAKIRKAIVDDDNLSTNAHNVKIVTRDGAVTLRGPVKSAAEKEAIAAKAQQVAGVKRVDNQLEIERQ